jgi:OOP family OmpA-OmpF porin
MKKSVFLGSLLLLAFTGNSHGGWLDTTLENAGKNLGNRGVNDAGNTAYEGAKGSVRGSAKDKPEAGNKSSQQDSVSSSKAGRRETAQATSDSSATIEEAESVYSKFDFVPGDKTIFFDDFSDTDVGEFPRKWHLNGPKGSKNSSVEVVEYQGKRFLRSNPAQKNTAQYESTLYIRLDQKGDLPEKFTIEFDAILNNDRKVHDYYLILSSDDKKWLGSGGKGLGKLRLSGAEGSSLNTATPMNIQDNRVHHISVSVNGTFVKAYIDTIRVINDPDAVKRPFKLIGLVMSPANRDQTDKLMFTNFRLAEGGKDVKSALDTDGKIVTHGILFDTGKDTLKPESLPTLKRILALLTDDPGLNFSIEGHTDSQGNPGINQPLSENRAEAVKTWLAGKGIDPSRLKTQGFGDSKPIDSNKTTEGRANNRRVEFVKF